MAHRPTFIVEAQRSNGTKYVSCPVHQVTSWAVIRIDLITRKGVRREERSVIGRYSTKTQAQGHADANTKCYAPTPRSQVRKLGLRIVKDDS